MTAQAYKCLTTKSKAMKIFGYVMILGGNVKILPEDDEVAVFFTIKEDEEMEVNSSNATSSSIFFELSKFEEITADELISQLHEKFISNAFKKD